MGFSNHVLSVRVMILKGGGLVGCESLGGLIFDPFFGIPIWEMRGDERGKAEKEGGDRLIVNRGR